jgi:hypothetical protein
LLLFTLAGLFGWHKQNGGPFGWVNLATPECGSIWRVCTAGLLKEKQGFNSREAKQYKRK